MVKIMKRTMSALLAVCMMAVMLSCVTGCGGSAHQPRRGDGETVTLTWGMSSAWATDQKDSATVTKVFNEKLQEFEQTKGINVEFVALNPDNYIQMMAAGEQMDIAWSGYAYDLTSTIQSDGFLKLNDYITQEEYPNIWREWKEEYVNDYFSGTYVDSEGNEGLYAIPNQQPLISQTPYLQIPESLIDCLDIDAMKKARAKSPYLTAEFMDVLDDYLQNVFDRKLYNTATVGDTVAMEGLFGVIGKLGYGKVGTAPVNYRIWDENGKINETVELVDYYQSDEFKLFCKYAAKWYDNGWIPKDALTSAEGAGGALSMILYGHINGMWYGLEDEENGIDERYDKFGSLQYYNVNINPSDFRWSAGGASSLGSEATYLSLPVTCPHPYDALDLIDFLRSPAYVLDENGEPKVDENGVKIRTPENELLNLLVYGFEEGSEEAEQTGVSHYTLGGEDGELIQGEYTIQPDANSSYGRCWWAMGNVYLMRRTSAWEAGQSDYARNYETVVAKTFPKTPIYRFRENVTEIGDEISYVDNTETEYLQTLRYGVKGSKGWEAEYKAFINKRKAAGIDKILSEMQGQVDAYTAK